VKPLSNKPERYGRFISGVQQPTGVPPQYAANAIQSDTFKPALFTVRTSWHVKYTAL